MRTKFLLVVTIVLLAILVAVPVYYASASPKPHVANSAAQSDVVCTDADFITAIGKDFDDLSAQINKLDKTNSKDDVKAVLILASLRQKYEDMTGVPTECFPTQVSLVVLLSNLSDVYALKLGKAADPDNAKDYDKALEGQVARNDKLLKNFQSSMGAAATATAESGS
jgi:hypothetical protein